MSNRIFFWKWLLPPPPPRQNASCSLAREEQPERLPSYYITIKWSRFGHAEIYALVRQWTTRLIPRSKTVSSHQISILPRNQGLFISVARKLVNFEGNRVVSTALMGHVNKCLYLSRSCYHTAVSRSWPHHFRTEFQRFFQVSRRLEHFRCPFVPYFLFSSLVDSF